MKKLLLVLALLLIVGCQTNVGADLSINVNPVQSSYDVSETVTVTILNQGSASAWNVVLDVNNNKIELGTLGVGEQTNVNILVSDYSNCGSTLNLYADTTSIKLSETDASKTIDVVCLTNETGQYLNSVEGDRQALIDLYQATDGDNWINNSGWLSTKPLGEWHGIETDADGRVIKIDLMANGLRGELPTGKWGNLNRNTWLNTKINNLTGELPKDIGQMHNLEWLMLSGRPMIPDWDMQWESGYDNDEDNNFYGTIPKEWSGLVNLRVFELSRTSLTGPYPAEWSTWTNIHHFNSARHRRPLGSNLPPEWKTWVNIFSFNVENNAHLYGPLPKEWGTWTNIHHFRISGNFNSPTLTGPIPEEWAAWENIRKLTIAGSEIGLSAPEFPELFMRREVWPRLHSPYFQRNNFQKLPENISGFGNDGLLATFNFQNNNITGPFPHEIVSDSAFRRLVLLYLDGNNFYGELPQEGWNTSRVWRVIRLDRNNFEGELPVGMGDIKTSVYTHWVKLDNNNFTGIIPENWANWQANGWTGLHLQNNNLYGKITVPLNNFQPNTHHSMGGFRVNNNRYTYKDIVPVLELKDWNLFVYSPQKRFAIWEEGQMLVNPNQVVNSGSTLNLDLSGVHITGNNYQWFKDGVAVSGQTSHTLSISNVNSGHSGDYSLRITNSRAPQLEFSQSEIIKVTVN